MNRNSRCRRLQPLGRVAQSNRLDFAFDLARAPCFALLGCVTDHAFGDRDAGRGVTQRLALEQDAGEFNAVQLEPP